jgi:hypothetical protein
VIAESLFARLEAEDLGDDLFVRLAEPVLAARIGEVGARFDETPADYVANGIRRFAALADDEDWLGLSTALERADDPEATVVRRMMLWSLDQDERACGCGHAHPPAP